MDHSVAVSPTIYRKVKRGERRILIIDNLGRGVQIGDLIDLECTSQQQVKLRVKVTDFTNECLIQNYLALTFESADHLSDEALASRALTTVQTGADIRKKQSSNAPEHILNRCVSTERLIEKRDYEKAIRDLDKPRSNAKQKQHVKYCREQLKRIDDEFKEKYGY